jgi:hypothetical protein
LQTWCPVIKEKVGGATVQAKMAAGPGMFVRAALPHAHGPALEPAPTTVVIVACNMACGMAPCPVSHDGRQAIVITHFNAPSGKYSSRFHILLLPCLQRRKLNDVT